MTHTLDFPEATPAYLQHTDGRAARLLVLAQMAADGDLTTARQLTFIAPGIVPFVPVEQAQAAFTTIYQDLEEAIDFDTRGAEAVAEQYGLDPLDYMSGDEKATELCAERRESARRNVEMLVTLNDKLAAQHRAAA